MEPSKAPSTKTILIIAGAVIGLLGLMTVCCCGMAVLGQGVVKQKRQDLADADRLWAEGKKDEAATKYRSLLSSRELLEPQMPTIYGRLIDHAFEAGNATEGERLLKEAEKYKIAVSVTHPAAKSALVVGQTQKKQAAKTSSQTVGSETVFESEVEFSAVVMGRTSDEVVAAIGKPKYVHPRGKFTNGEWYDESWVYERRLRHKATGKLQDVQIFITGDRVIGTEIE